MNPNPNDLADLDDLLPPPVGLRRLQLFLSDMGRVARLALLVTLGQLVVCVGAVVLAFHLLHQPQQFVVVDPSGNVLPVPGKPFPEARELHVLESLLVTSALLTRNPRDFDQVEYLDAALTPQARAESRRLLEADATEFLDRHMHQKPQVAHIEALANHQGQVQVQVSGEVRRWGFVQQSPFADAIPFTLRLTLRHNPDLLRLRQRPLVVESFTLLYENPKL